MLASTAPSAAGLVGRGTIRWWDVASPCGTWHCVRPPA